MTMYVVITLAPQPAHSGFHADFMRDFVRICFSLFCFDAVCEWARKKTERHSEKKKTLCWNEKERDRDERKKTHYIISSKAICCRNIIKIAPKNSNMSKVNSCVFLRD